MYLIGFIIKMFCSTCTCLNGKGYHSKLRDIFVCALLGLHYTMRPCVLRCLYTEVLRKSVIKTAVHFSSTLLSFSRNYQQDATLQQNLLFHRSLKAQHVSIGTPLIIRSSNCICSLWFTYACGDRP